jgi:hypothetical protein
MTQSSLLFNGSCNLSRHTSRLGAESSSERAPSQLVRMIQAYTDAPDGKTDHEMAAYLRIPLASVCARRAPLRKAGLIYCEGVRKGPYTASNAIWRWRR